MDAEAYVDMLPWLVFVMMDRKLGLGVAWAGGSSLGCSAGLVVWSYWRGRYALLPSIATGIFAACLVSALVFPAWNDQVSLPRALVVATLGLLAFGSLRFTPLSETYTVRLVAPGLREDPRFRKVNVEMTLAWGVGSLVVALACSTTALLPGRLAFTLLDWVAPLVLATVTILWSARRWELFRLAVDADPALHHVVEPTVHAHLGTRGSIGPFGTRPLPLRRATSAELSEPARDGEPAGEGGRDAIIRQLPVRGRNVEAARAD
jgi:hypothetical protein